MAFIKKSKSRARSGGHRENQRRSSGFNRSKSPGRTRRSYGGKRG